MKGFNVLIPARHGLMLCNRHDQYVGRSIIEYGEFSELETELFRQICGLGDFVVEVGANIGAHTLSLAQIVGPAGVVHAIEAQAIVHQTLCANMALNSVTNVRCHWVAAGERSGTVRIPAINYAQSGNFGGVEIDKFESGEPVALVRLDDLLDLARCRLLKLDVEGMEAAVLRGATGLIAAHRPILYVENDRLEKSQELIELIRGFGYRLWWHMPPLFNPNNHFGNRNNVFGRVVSVNMLCVHESWDTNFSGL